MTLAAFDLIVSGGQCVTPGGVVETDIGVTAGRIGAIGDLSASPCAQRIDARHLHVLPGVIDSQVHFREPGLEHKEDLATGTAAAALGGVTSIFEMPNTNPSTVTAADLAAKVERSRGRVFSDVAFFFGASAENATELGTFERLPGCAGVKVFMGSSTGSLLVEDDVALQAVLHNGRRRVAIHAEDEPRLRARRHLVDGPDATPALHPVWRDEQTALIATKRALACARIARRPVHILHVTTADEMLLLRDHKDLATVEVTPQHLTLFAPDCYERLGTYAQMNPPIREARHREALWRAFADGTVDVIGSDHAPHTRAEKDRPYPQSPSGMPGVQTLVPLMLDHVNAGRLTLQRLVDLVCHGPARIYGVAAKGRLAVGMDADLTLVDLAREHVIADADMASRCGWTPFAGQRVLGCVETTILRGHIVMAAGKLVGPPRGQTVHFF